MLVKTYANVINDMFSNEETYIFTQIETDKYNQPLERYEYSFNRRVITRYEYDENHNLIGIKSGRKIEKIIIEEYVMNLLDFMPKQ